jgi:hypothetical protein
VSVKSSAGQGNMIQEKLNSCYERTVFSRPEELPFENHISINPIFVNGVGFAKKFNH